MQYGPTSAAYGVGKKTYQMTISKIYSDSQFQDQANVFMR